jgi:hypothetical protein
MSLYKENKEIKQETKYIEFQKTRKIIENLFIIYTIIAIIYNTIILIAQNPITSSHFLPGYLLGATVIIISVTHLIKARSINIFIIALIYLICSLFTLTLNIKEGLVDADSVILWSDPLWFLALITENIYIDMPIKIFLFLQYFSAALIFSILFSISWKNRAHTK